MSQRITFEPAARRGLRKIEQQTAKRILEALARFVFLDEGDIKQLKGVEPPEFRLRIGDYRLRFRQDGDLIHVLAVAHRREVYR